MKKLLPILALLLLLTGCSKEEISGEVQSVTPRGQYIELTIVGREDIVLADANTHVYSFSDEISHEKLLTGELIRPVITAYEMRKLDGAWLAERICVESVISPEPCVLSDGTPLNIRQSYNGTIYETLNGWEILWEQAPIGPENVSVGGLPSLADLKPEAQANIIDYYDTLGLLYDLDDELEKAYLEFLSFGNPTGFHSHHLAQDICPTAANDKLVWYSSYVTRPVGDGLHQQSSTHTVFDRETGNIVDPAELFACSEAELGKRILEIVSMPDTQLSWEMEQAFRFEYLNFNSNFLDVCFPAGSLISQNTNHMLGIEYQDLEGFIHPWAIPDPIA